MYSPLHHQTHQRYASLNTSAMQTTPSHHRTQSNTKIFIAPLQQQQRQKVPSQKKLTITCHNNIANNRIYIPEGGTHLKKTSGDYKEMKTKFASLQTSQVRDSQPTTCRQNAQECQLAQIKKNFVERFRQLERAYACSLKEYENQIKMLQLRLLENTRQLDAKAKRIQTLQSICSKYKQKLQKMPQQSYNINLLTKKISDLEAILRILVFHSEEMKQEQDSSLDNITHKLVSTLGKRVSKMRMQTDNFINIGTNSIQKLEQTVQRLKQKSDRLSEGTRGSMESMGSQRKKTNPLSHNQEQCGISFWDDCFFIPHQCQTSENYELIVQMSKRREQILTCWIDQFQYLRYCDSNSYIFNRKGDRVRLCKEQIKQLVRLKLLLIL